MLTLSPLPDLKLLFRSFFTFNINYKKISSKWHKNDEVGIFFSRSSWSIAYIAYVRKRINPDKKIIVWIPDYFCNESLLQLRHIGVNLIFFPVNDEMKPIISSFPKLLENGKPDVLLFVHYFGNPTPAENIKEFCKNNGTWLVEDATHILRPIKAIGNLGDFVMYSMHKHLPIPDGAILILRKNGPSNLLNNQISLFSKPYVLSDFTKYLVKNNLQIHSKLFSNAKFFQWVLKKLIQKVSFFKFKSRLDDFYSNVQNPYISISPAKISKFSIKMLSHLIFDLDNIAQVKKENQKIFDYIVGNNLFFKSNINNTDRPIFDSWDSYISGYFIKKGMEDLIYKEMIKNGLPVSTWPDLPPEVIFDKDKHISAWNLRHSRIYLSIHQGTNLSNLIKNSPLQWLDKHFQKSIITWNKIDRKQWNEYISISNNSNLLQTWDYGETKREIEGWNIKRLVFFKNQIPIAVLQVLEKKMLGIITISRVNRGPILISTISEREKYNLINSISSFGNLFKFKILFIAPELLLTGKNLFYLYRSGFRRKSKINWKSSLIDLTINTDELRKMLDGKWRNMLNFSEKSDLHLQYSSEQDLFDWMLNSYSNLMVEKGFQGPSIDFLNTLKIQTQLNYCKKSLLIVFRAVKNGIPVGGICIALHGSAATYLLGFNTSEGRDLKTTQFLLWKSILFLKENNFKFLDLGGIDKINTPGVAQFKMGLNGKYYENIGEFIKW